MTLDRRPLRRPVSRQPVGARLGRQVPISTMEWRHRPRERHPLVRTSKGHDRDDPGCASFVDEKRPGDQPTRGMAQKRQRPLDFPELGPQAFGVFFDRTVALDDRPDHAMPVCHQCLGHARQHPFGAVHDGETVQQNKRRFGRVFQGASGFVAEKTIAPDPVLDNARFRCPPLIAQELEMATPTTFDPFGTRRTLTTTGGAVGYYSLPELAKRGLAPLLDKLPFSIRVLLEAVLRNCDGFSVTNTDVEKLGKWNAAAPVQDELPFKPARVILQDFGRAGGRGHCGHASGRLTPRWRRGSCPSH